MNNKIIRLNKKIRKNRPLVTDKYNVYVDNNILQICFSSKGCNYYLNGNCIMCDYGKSYNLSKEEIIVSFNEAINYMNNKTTVLLLNSFGSILDEREINREGLVSILNIINYIPIKNIIFETHYLTIDDEILKILNKNLNNKNIIIEMGLETSNKNIRENNLFKIIDNNKFLDKVSLIHKYNMRAIANILVGIPFLSRKGIIKDVVNSIDWCFNNDIDEVVLFLANIKKYTYLYKLYLEGKYKLVDYKILYDILKNIDINYLDRIYLSWYKERNFDNTIFTNIDNDLLTFYDNFSKNKDIIYRKKLLDRF